uniref:Uncharacterized protein n=1 Tax=Steinernema glaseri TaxID=37863 RepID=A0A1I7ZRI1_9BILA
MSEANMNAAHALQEVAKALETIDRTLIWVLVVWIVIVAVAVASRFYFIWSQGGIDKKVKRLEHVQQQLKKHYGRPSRRRSLSHSKSKTSKKKKSKKHSKGKKERSSKKAHRHVTIDMTGSKTERKASSDMCSGSGEKKAVCQLAQNLATSKSASSEDIMKYFAQATVIYPDLLKEEKTQNSSSKESIVSTQRTAESVKASPSTASTPTESKTPTESSLSSSLLATIRPEPVVEFTAPSSTLKTNGTQGSANSARAPPSSTTTSTSGAREAVPQNTMEGVNKGK